MITQDSLKYYIARSGVNPPTVVYLLSRINSANGKADVRIIENGLLEAPNGSVIKGFQLVHGILKFVKKDFEVRFNGNYAMMTHIEELCKEPSYRIPQGLSREDRRNYVRNLNKTLTPQFE